MSKEYRNIGSPSDKIIEEASELIKAIIKAKRFGYNNCHPDNYPCHSLPKKDWCDHSGGGGFMGHTCGEVRSNMDDIVIEFGDLVESWNDFCLHEGLPRQQFPRGGYSSGK